MNAPVHLRLHRFFLLPAVFALSAHAALAATITVDSTADPGTAADGQCTLREAILNANANTDTSGGDCIAGSGADLVTFSETLLSQTEQSTRTIVLGEAEPAFPITDTLSIDGDNPAIGDDTGRIFIDANGTQAQPRTATSRVFEVQAPATLRHLIVNGGDAGSGDGGCILANADLTLEVVTFNDCHAARGGGVFLASGTALTMSNGGIGTSTGEQGGGALWVEPSASAAITASLFIGNLAGVYQDVPDDIGEGTHREPSDTAPAADGGALYLTAGANVTITKGDAPLALISSNQATGSGGGIYNEGNLTIRNTQIQFNEALVLGTRTSPGGGQIYNAGGSVDLEQVLMNNGEATGDRPEGAGEDNTGMGGAILSSGGELTVNLSQVQSNLAGAAGGAIALIDGAMATITRSAFASNAAVGNATAARGGAIYANAAADLTIKLSSMNLNQGGTEGGAMWLHDTDATLAAVSIRNNTAPDGGGIYLSGASTVTVNDGQLLRNVAQNVPKTDSDPVTGSGGAILNDGATLVVNGSLISRNSAADSGAGIYTTGGGTTSLVDTVVGGDDPEDGNMTGTDPGQGGGLYVDDGTLTIDRSTIAFNTASQGGGIWAGNLATVIAANSTISNNQATGGESTANGDGGGIFQTAGGSTTLTYSTVAENSANGDGGGLAVGGSTAASIFLNSSIVSANQANGLDDDFADNGSVVASNSVVRAADAGLQDLQLFGGPTATYPLTATSQALDIGDPSTCSAPPVSSLDQRAAVRPIDGNADATAACDAGSFERNPGLPRLDVSSNGPPVTGIDLGNGETLTNGIVLLAFSLHNPSTTEGVTVASFNARPYFNANLQLQSGGLLTGVGLLRNLLPPDFDSDSSSIDFLVIKDVDGDGKLDPEDVQSVGEDVDDLGTEFTFDSGGLQIPPGGEQDLLVVVRVPDAAPVTSNGYPVTPWYAGGMLLALFGVFGLGGIRQRSRWILAVLVIAVGLAACSKGDDEPPPDFTFFGDPALQGLLRYELIALNTTSGAPIVAPDLPVYGPVISN